MFGIQFSRKGVSCAIVASTLAWATSAGAVTVELTVVDSHSAFTNPFGVLFDGTNVWVSSGVGGNRIFQVDQTTAGMPLTGVSRTLTGGGTGAMAWDGTHFVSASGHSVNFFNAATGALVSTTTVTSLATGSSLIDGLDFDHNEIWYSPDIGNVYRLNSSGNFTGPFNPLPFPPGGGFSGVERVDVGANSFAVVVNDAFSPRKLCVEDYTTGTEIGCAALPNTRYEDLAFDGRFIYAADVFGNRFDKIDLCIRENPNAACNSIFVPPSNGVPEPGSLALAGLGLAGLAAFRRRQTK